MTEPALHHLPDKERSADVVAKNQGATPSHQPVTFKRIAGTLLVGAMIWGGMMAISAVGALYLTNGLQTSHIGALILLFFLGGLFAWPFLIALGQFFARGKGIETRFAAFFVLLTCGTLAMTAFLFAMEYRLFYARWHAPFGTQIWFLQFAFTSASAVYQFSVVGMRLFLPFGLICLIAASMVLAKRIR